MTEGFREVPERELDNKSDEELVDYIRAALAAVRERPVEAAIERLFDRYTGRILALVQGKMPRTGRAEEITQDVFEAATAAIFAGKPIDSFRAWIFRVARNKIADFWRSPDGARIKALRAVGDDDNLAPADGVSTDDQDAFELQDLIDSVADSLKESHRSIVDLYVFGDRSAREVAAETGESEANVHQVAKRFRDKLRSLLEGHGYEVGS